MVPRTLACVVAAVAILGCEAPRPTPPAREVDPRFEVPAFTLTDRSGKSVSAADLRGKVWVASFVFTRCTGPCPAVTGTVARLQSELAGEPDVRFVTFTVDPGRDDPKELAGYAERYRADPDRWLFLTGEEDAIRKLLVDGFKVPVVRNAKAQPGDEFDHSTRLAVVDRDGRIRGYYEGLAGPDDPTGEAFEGSFRRLKDKVAVLLHEGR